MFRHLLSLFLTLSTAALFSQSNVRAWYADGQVWVVWEAEFPLPETYCIYAKTTSFNSTTEALQVGRLFAWEYGAGALKEQVDTLATFRVPDGNGGLYQLALNEGLFVFTPHQAGALWFAVAPFGETAVNSDNRTAGAVSFQYAPILDPVECHLQRAFPSPFNPNFTCFAYYMWCDGRQAQWDSRPDFPVTANLAKNGMPGFFMVSVPNNIDTTGLVPLSVWLHGGGGIARQSLAGSRAIVNINPQEGILLAQNDDLMGYRNTILPDPELPSWHFGWRKNYDPFTTDNIPTGVDTVVNYTQRRYIWIDNWMIRRFPIDVNRVNINGHSMGAAGSTALGKIYPQHYASVTAFANGFGGPEPGSGAVLFGPVELNFPTNLINRAGQAVGFATIFNLTDNCSPERDLPIFRSYCGKNDDNGTMMWDAYVVEQYRDADSLGHGMALMWSERNHDIGGAGDHWAMGNLPMQQTNFDNVAYEESNYYSNRSYPAFFNHRLDPSANDPGDGTIGTGINGVGDDWGAWGGWHRADLANIIDEPGSWSVVAWLEAGEVFANDNCPENQLAADLAIRRPQQFKPVTGKTLNWMAKDITTGNTLQSGTTTVQNDNLVVIPQITLYPENVRRVQIKVFDPTVAAKEIGQAMREANIWPNPSSQTPQLAVYTNQSTDGVLMVAGINGIAQTAKIDLKQGDNLLNMSAFQDLPAGFYTIRVITGSFEQSVNWVKL